MEIEIGAGDETQMSKQTVFTNFFSVNFFWHFCELPRAIFKCTTPRTFDLAQDLNLRQGFEFTKDP
jgi:hypothetical protein